jgi:hypothetical protein
MWLDFALEIASAARASDRVTFKYWKWKWLKAHQNIKVIERLWSSGYDIGFPMQCSKSLCAFCALHIDFSLI